MDCCKEQTIGQELETFTFNKYHSNSVRKCSLLEWEKLTYYCDWNWAGWIYLLHCYNYNFFIRILCLNIMDKKWSVKEIWQTNETTKDINLRFPRFINQGQTTGISEIAKKTCRCSCTGNCTLKVIQLSILKKSSIICNRIKWDNSFIWETFRDTVFLVYQQYLLGKRYIKSNEFQVSIYYYYLFIKWDFEIGVCPYVSIVFSNFCSYRYIFYNYVS